MWGSISTRLARAVGRVVRSRPAEVQWPGGVVSFTFDDFPKSALSVGGGLLEKYGWRGTYYTALALAGGTGDMGPMFDAEDLCAAHARGHELACHTHSHLDCSRAATPAIVADIAANGAAFAALLDGFAPQNFAFPFGALSLGAKRALAGRFASCRGIEWGINSGTVDLAHLSSTRLYHHDFGGDVLRRLVDRNRALGGWLIFYTHDVAAAPSPYGCTPDQLEAMIGYAAERCEILPVRDAVARLTSRT